MALNPESNSLPISISGGTRWGLTHTRVVKCTYTWTIDNFSFCTETVGEKITSPTFITEGYDNMHWCIDLYPMGKCTGDSGFVSIYIRLISCDRNEVAANIQITLIDSEGEEQNLKKTSKALIFNTVGLGSDKYISVKFLQEKTRDFLPEDKLTVRCKIFIVMDRINTTGRGDTPRFNIERSSILDDLGKLFEDMTLPDVTLVAGGAEIQAHKLIMSTRSAVFAAMFEHDMQEQKLSRVEITDVDNDTLKEMLNFMYTDRTPNLNKMAADLLVAADKYALDNLKLRCEETLSKNLSVETAANTLVLADVHSAAVLKEHTIAFINAGHATMVMATEGWKNMTVTHPHLVAELFQALTLQMHQG